jgi:hypothetical protein
MEKKPNKMQNNPKKLKSAILELLQNDLESEIRIGVAVAEEEASNESRKRRMSAPLTIEEKVFMHLV